MKGSVIEKGYLPCGTEYRIWEATGHWEQGTFVKKKVVYIGPYPGKKRNIRWLKKIKKGAE